MKLTMTTEEVMAMYRKAKTKTDKLLDKLKIIETRLTENKYENDDARQKDNDLYTMLECYIPD